MNKCEDLLPDYLSFIKGVVDSEDISLNISREMLQKTRELELIKKNLEKKVLAELEKILKNDREKYEEFFKNFGVVLKTGAYDNYGADADKLKDLFIYPSTKRDTVTLSEYRKDMKPDEDYIYYANGESLEEIKKLPQIKSYIDKDIEVIALTDAIDEFVIKVIGEYDGKKFKSISETSADSDDKKEDAPKYIIDMKEILKDEVVEIKENENLTEDAAYLSSKGEVSIDMEKTFQHMPGNQGFKAQKVLELNPNHSAVKKLKELSKDDEKFKSYTNLLYNGARLLAGLPVENKIEFVKELQKLM